MNLLQKFPSYDYILKSIRDTFIRFPFAVISTIIGTIMAVYLIDFNIEKDNFLQIKLLMLSILGLPLFISLAIFAEKLEWKILNRIYFQAVGVVLLLLYYLTLPEDMFLNENPGIRFLLLSIGLHFLIAFLPFYKGKMINGFWQYNKTLFLRFLTAALFSGVLYVGLLIALASADHLFGINVEDERYFQLWVIIIGIFHPLVFLSGFPKDYSELDNIKDFPKGLKVLAQYILLPLVVLYFVILIVYEGKILFTWNWPKGWVAQLVLWYSVVGIMSILLLHPLREMSKNRWIGIFSNWFFRVLIPLLIMLFIAIFKRISEYGITESRYFVFAMAIGLTIVILYFIFSKIKDIRIIPIIICCLAFVSSFGPWSAFAISESSQKDRLISILDKNDMIVDDVIVKAGEEIDFDDKKEISSIVSYLVDRHGLPSFDNMFPDKELTQFDTLLNYKTSLKNRITELMGFKYVYQWETSGQSSYYNLVMKNASVVGIYDYDQLILMNRMYMGYESKYIFLNRDSCLVSINKDSSFMEFTFPNDSTARRLDLKDPIIEMINSKPEFNNEIDADKMTFDLPDDNPGARVLIREISGNHHPDSIPTINSINYILLIDRQ